MSILESLINYRGFVVYRLAPITGKPNKTDKIPFSGITGFNLNAQDSKNWLLPAEAQAMATAWAPTYPHGTGVGLVIAQGCQIAFIDLDGCIVDGMVTPLAQSILARFPGAVVEISQSGTGLHIFFMYRGIAPPHKTKNTHHHIEAYTKERFAALTGNYLSPGWIGTDHTDALFAFLAEYFPKSGDDYEGEWTDTPAAGWDFIQDDDALLEWARNFRDSKAVFGSKASFAALFDADADVLGQFFPSTTGNAYDASSADQALANFFAWATGNNMERTSRLMRRSALARSKWEREDYYGRTIGRACTGDKRWPTMRVPVPPTSAAVQPATQAPVSVPETSVAADVPLPPTAEQQAAREAAPPARGLIYFTGDQSKWFKGYTYVEDIHRIMDPAGHLLEKKQFDLREPFAGREFQMSTDGDTDKSAWDAFTSGLVEHPKVRGTYFEPREAPLTILMRDGDRFVNTWKPVDIVATPGNPQWFIDHIRRLLPVGQDAHILLQFLKFMVQCKGSKAAWFPFIQGVEGNGKSFINDTMQYCLSARYTHRPRPTELAGRFNSAFYGKLFIRIEDIQMGEAIHIWEALKPMVDGKELEIEWKGVDKVTREVCFNMIATSNWKAGIPVTTNDRRVAPFFCAQQQRADLTRDGLTTEYFTRMWAHAQSGGWANVLHYLATDPIDPQYNPAVEAIRAPATSSTFDAKHETLGAVEQEILEAVEIGADGFRGGWISMGAVDRLVKQAGKDRALSINKRRAMLVSLGYVPHPGLADGRVASPLPDGTRPRLYVKPDHSAYALTDRAIIRQLFLNANGPPLPG